MHVESNQFVHHPHGFSSSLQLVPLFCFPCLYLFAWSTDNMGRIRQENAAVRLVLCSHEPALFPLLFSLLPGEGLSHADSERPCPHTPQAQPSGWKHCPPHLTRRAPHWPGTDDVLPGSAHLLAEDQQDGTAQHFNRHTATWRKPEQEGHKAVP